MTLNTAPLRVLYVEDNRVNALLFEQALRLHGGIELRVAEDGTEALQIAQAWTPDVLVLDSHLPGLTGHELLPRLRELPGFADLPAFMCSADTEPDDVQRALAAGFRGHWGKPLDVQRMLADLRQAAQAR
jgi:CheY-like chemotaxis protein